jgi:dolichol kinase
MLRTHEKSATKKTLNGASWILLSAIVCILAFPKVIAVTAFAILIISDSSAAIIGRRFGTRRYRDKSLQGSIAFVISAWIVVLFTPKIGYLPGEYIAAGVAAIFGAVAEVFSFGIIDDNFAIPVSIGAVLWLSYLIFLPHLNVFLLG